MRFKPGERVVCVRPECTLGHWVAPGQVITVDRPLVFGLFYIRGYPDLLWSSRNFRSMERAHPPKRRWLKTPITIGDVMAFLAVMFLLRVLFG